MPSNTVQAVVSELLQFGRVRRRQLGIVAGVCHIARTTIVELDLLSENAVEVIEVDRRVSRIKSGCKREI